MKLPFFSRFAVKRNGVFQEMEEITDKTLREFLRTPGEDGLLIADAIHADSNKTRVVVEEMEQTLPVFCRLVRMLSGGMEETEIFSQTGVLPAYIRSLHQIMERQQLEED